MNQKTGEEDWWRFITTCQAASSVKTIETVMQLFFTAEELQALSGRVRIIMELLRAELTQRQLAEQYGVSIAKVTRGSNSLKHIDAGMRRFLEQHLL